ncbi:MULTISPECIES: dethiobiotin synthase [Phyllobacteriaceae]|jgi:dethiobiotin synthetase|uniref:ATP-dependent dethiobiotin synthetase BioD n=1 Tax=Mesorhizobium hungaricum TaxID=1566387 RepID=A0A1C2DIK5_9HYPH|nr:MULTISPECIES: dethiobiotin synthase [Mesorhizobium]MBN9234445.1 ATP-dependent dethiobiotin synthetase BioD [Mesorhizobium sp.]MDQ0332514.1 dethiobiotin synthetase [Mesorhizobium sp. YL-MeA3-2017]OCX14476.1 dethiobiotin synthase [Mesorhizobium hungaricum]
MTTRIVVTGTDTNVGKTVFAAGLTGFLGASYWKPVQAGLLSETDSETVMRLGGIPAQRILPEAWRLNAPASPHHAAAIDGVAIDPEKLTIPQTQGPLVIEGVGGVLAPLTRTVTFADLVARWQVPAVLCARTRLGTINHTLLSLEALRARAVPVLGIAFIGDPEPETERIICEMGRTKSLGRLPLLDPSTPTTLHAAFAAAFRTEDFLSGSAHSLFAGQNTG